MSAIEESQEDTAEYSISSSTTGTMESQRPRAGNIHFYCFENNYQGHHFLLIKYSDLFYICRKWPWLGTFICSIFSHKCYSWSWSSQLPSSVWPSGWHCSCYCRARCKYSGPCGSFQYTNETVLTETWFQVLILWIVGALLILAHCAEKAGALTLQDVLQAACGQTGLITCSIVVALYCFGTCVTFLIIIGDQSDRGNSSV